MTLLQISVPKDYEYDITISRRTNSNVQKQGTFFDHDNLSKKKPESIFNWLGYGMIGPVFITNKTTK